VIVVDASALVEWTLRSAAGRAVTAHLETHEGSTHAPSFVVVEAANALRRLAARELIDDLRADVSFYAVHTLPLTRHDPAAFMRRAWALRASLTSYDAVYVALAESLRAPLLTCDARMARSHGHTAEVTVAS
jgi:predicted nucleic acid-binding protein